MQTGKSSPWGRDTTTLITLGLLIIFGSFGQARSASVALHPLDFNNGISQTPDPTGGAYSSEATFATFALLFTMIAFVILCTGGCCPSIFTKRQEEDPQALQEMGEVEFEPLPVLDDRIRSPFSEVSPVETIVPAPTPTPTDEASADICVHDSLEEKTNNFPRTCIEYGKELGQGWFGKVIESEAESIVSYTKKLGVVVKVLHDDASEAEQKRFLDESQPYRESDHENIMKLLGESLEKPPLLLIMEHCPRGDLKSYLIANVARAEMFHSQGVLLRMGHDIAKGLEWMSSAGFIHEDLAARNCQVGNDGRIIIGDYGLSSQNFPDDYYWGSRFPIPLRWSAPETLECTMNTVLPLKLLKSSSVWSFGVVLWEIFEFGRLPYFELSDNDVIKFVISERNCTLGHLSRPVFAARDEVYNIMLSCWNAVPDFRPSISSVVDQIESLCSSKPYTPVQSNVFVKSSATYTKEEDFDRKWDEFSERINSPPEVEETKSELTWGSNQRSGIRNFSNINLFSVSGNKNKSVSFVGFDDEIPVQDRPRLPKVHEIEDTLQAQKGAKAIPGSAPVKKSQTSVLKSSLNCNRQSHSMEFIGNSVASMLSSNDAFWKVAPESKEANWRKKIDFEEISSIEDETSQRAQGFVAVPPVPSYSSDPNSLNASSAHTITHSTTWISSGSEYTESSSDPSSVINATVLRKFNSNSTDVAHSIAQDPNIEGEEEGAGVRKRLCGTEDTSKAYSADISTSFNSVPIMSLTAVDNSEPGDYSTSLFSTDTTFASSEPSVLHGTDSENSESPVTDVLLSTSAVTSSQLNSDYQDNIASVTWVFSGPQSNETKTVGLDAISFPFELSSKKKTPNTSAPAALVTPQLAMNSPSREYNAFPVSTPTATLTKVRDEFDRRSSQKVQRNFRNTKTSTPNFSPDPFGDDLFDAENSSFFQRDDDVFEDFSMEFSGNVSPISQAAAAPPQLYITGVNDDIYGHSNNLPGTSKDPSLNLCRRITHELASESTSSGSSASIDYFDGITHRDSLQITCIPQLDADWMSDRAKSGFQDIFGKTDVKSTPYELVTHISGTDESSVSMSVKGKPAIARKLNFDSDSSLQANNLTAKSSEGSTTIVYRKVTATKRALELSLLEGREESGNDGISSSAENRDSHIGSETMIKYIEEGFEYLHTSESSLAVWSGDDIGESDQPRANSEETADALETESDLKEGIEEVTQIQETPEEPQVPPEMSLFRNPDSGKKPHVLLVGNIMDEYKSKDVGENVGDSTRLSTGKLQLRDSGVGFSGNTF